MKDGGRNKERPSSFVSSRVSQSDNGVNNSHDPWSMGNASFESHVTSTRDQPMTRASLQCSRLQFFGLYEDQGSTYVFIIFTVHKEGSNTLYIPGFWLGNLDGVYGSFKQG
ncbi:hypothetical protein K492DRAFT_192537 [Lichtheimia hyalospora FSU 10163]|nr:hypothetical protein K492DRAFT_192537 [Lichtheimia hyalospora FSU 10163]